MKTGTRLLAAAMLALAAAGASLTGCSGSKTSDTASDSASVTVLTVDCLMADPAAYADDTVTVEGLCTHLCSHGATKAFLANADTSLMLRCNATEAIGGAFDSTCVGKIITVSGIVRPQTLGKSRIEALAAAEATPDTTADAHCGTDSRATGTATQWLEKLNAQLAAGGDTTLTVAYYLEAMSYTVPVE